MRIGTRLAMAGVAAAALAVGTPAAAGVIGCKASGDKQEGGAVIGAVLGGLVGNGLSSHDRGTGTVVGAATGAAAGSYVGCEMQKTDAERAGTTASRPRASTTTTTTTRRVTDDRYDDDDDRYEGRRDEGGRYEERRYETRRYEVRGDDDDDDGPRYREDDRRFVPPGLAKKPYGMPPGQAKKYYGVGERVPVTYVRETRYVVVEPRRYHLRPAPAGYRWVLIDRDAYLVGSETGLVREVVRAIIG